MSTEPLLAIERLRVVFGSSSVPAVDDVSLEVPRGRRVGIIGESGSGKSVTAMSVLRLNDERKMRYGPGSSIRFDGTDLLAASDRRLRDLRGAEISMIFQDPMSTLNPVFKVGRQIMDVLLTHRSSSGLTAGKWFGRPQPRDVAEQHVLDSLRSVGIHDAERVFDRYPHELSGGLRQRIMIAMAIASRPRLLIADEATSALDVTVQAAVLDTMGDLADQLGMSVLMITHDMGVVARFCDDVYVMRAGTVVESGSVQRILTEPSHAYTRQLLDAVPRVTR